MLNTLKLFCDNYANVAVPDCFCNIKQEMVITNVFSLQICLALHLKQFIYNLIEEYIFPYDAFRMP